MAEHKVEVSNLSKSFGDLEVLDDISFNVKEGEFLCIVGPTGCGKTTFLNSLTTLYEPTSGEILIDGVPVNLREHDLAYIFQEYSTMPWLTVRQNIEYGLKIKKYDRKRIDEKVNEVVKLVGLEDYINSYPRELSTSLVQRVVIARAFAVEPELLLMDEPYGQLDAGLRFKLEDELLSIWKATNSTIIFITHNIEEAVYLGERVLILSDKPTNIKETIDIDLSYPRDITDEKFIEYRNKITEEIRWW